MWCNSKVFHELVWQMTSEEWDERQLRLNQPECNNLVKFIKSKHSNSLNFKVIFKVQWREKRIWRLTNQNIYKTWIDNVWFMNSLKSYLPTLILFYKQRMIKETTYLVGLFWILYSRFLCLLLSFWEKMYTCCLKKFKK